MRRRLPLERARDSTVGRIQNTYRVRKMSSSGTADGINFHPGDNA